MWTRSILRHGRMAVCNGVFAESGIRCFFSVCGRRKARGAVKGGNPC